MALISCRDLSFAYERTIVLRGINFTVEQGDYLWVIGENGSGKSTLVRGILGLKKPSAGTIHLDEGLTRREIGYLPQHLEAKQDFPASVYEVVLSGRLGKLAGRPFYSRRDKEAAEENLVRLGIGDLRKKCYRELSGGQQQRALLARSLCAGSRLLILDEPVAGLDPLAGAELYRLLEELNRGKSGLAGGMAGGHAGLTIVMVSHDTQGAGRYASRILHLENEQLFFGSPLDYRNSTIGKKFGGEA